MEREMENLFGRLVRAWPFPRLFGEGREVAPAVDMLDRKDQVVLRVDLPGLDQKDIALTVEEAMWRHGSFHNGSIRYPLT